MGVSRLEPSPAPPSLLNEVAPGLDAALLLRPLVFPVMVVAIRPVEIAGKRRFTVGTAARFIAARLDASRKEAPPATPLAAIGPLTAAPFEFGAQPMVDTALAV